MLQSFLAFHLTFFIFVKWFIRIRDHLYALQVSQRVWKQQYPEECVCVGGGVHDSCAMFHPPLPHISELSMVFILCFPSCSHLCLHYFLSGSSSVWIPHLFLLEQPAEILMVLTYFKNNDTDESNGWGEIVRVPPNSNKQKIRWSWLISFQFSKGAVLKDSISAKNWIQQEIIQGTLGLEVQYNDKETLMLQADTSALTLSPV